VKLSFEKGMPGSTRSVKAGMARREMTGKEMAPKEITGK
jgi:hypothetical protein